MSNINREYFIELLNCDGTTDRSWTTSNTPNFTSSVCKFKDTSGRIVMITGTIVVTTERIKRR